MKGWGLVLILGFYGVAGAVDKVPERPKMDLVFVLDTTGSMGGLIEGAKRKIWAIANGLASAKPTPELRIGLVGYRDIGDDYVTKVHDLSSDLDKMFEQLTVFTAGGGGDTPEHVNRALHEAVNTISWSGDRHTVKTIFLVGDAPPHLDYQDQFDYRQAAREAVRKHIVINTVRCGGDTTTEAVWQEIARSAEGVYTSIQQDGGMVAVATPFDKDLAQLNHQLNGTVLFFGRHQKEKSQGFRESEKKLGDMAVRASGGMEAGEAVADRAVFAASAPMSKKSAVAGWDLLEAVSSGQTKVESLKKDEVPEVMQAMSLEEQKAFLGKKQAERNSVRLQIEEISKKRAAFLQAILKKQGGQDGFDQTVLKAVKAQAKKQGVILE